MSTIRDNQPNNWHSLSVQDILMLLKIDSNRGLSEEEVAHRRAQYGPNRISQAKGKGPLIRFLLQFHQPLVYILIIAGLVTAWLGEWVDSSVIFGVVLLNAVIGFVQESKAISALSALSNMLIAETTVLRGGERHRIPVDELVPGDIVLLQSGDKVPADLRLIHVRDLHVNESALTGESVPVSKQLEALPADVGVADRTNMAFASSLVTFGQATGVVVATGDHTEVGRIAGLIAGAQDISTPLTRKMASFSTFLLYVILALAGGVIALGLWRNEPFEQVFMAAVALAVGAIPEGLPAAITITLAIGVSRMAKKNAIIRKLPAVETLGSTTVICSDKTGTLTQNQMTVQEIYAGGGRYTLTGVGYTTEGDIIPPDAVENMAVLETIRAGVLCNDSKLVDKDGSMEVVGDPTEGALLVSGAKLGYFQQDLNVSQSRVDALPFESEYQYMATLHRVADGSKVIYLKGAPEVIVRRCDKELGTNGEITSFSPEKTLETVHDMANRGFRVLAFAARFDYPDDHLTHEDVRGGLVFLGLQAMIDPPREEAIQAVAACHRAGIDVKMITGDHVVTAKAIAGAIGLGHKMALNIFRSAHGHLFRAVNNLPPGGRFADGGPPSESLGPPHSTNTHAPTSVDSTNFGLPDVQSQQGEIVAVTGQELGQISDDELKDRIEDITVFARVSPDQKMRLVQALQAKGHIVAMTGDGVNDAPALKAADIGVAMGKNGTDVARDAADMVLVDDNFSSIEAAVEEGRCVFDNLTKFIVWTLPTNLGEGLVILAAMLLGVTLPILPVQILWINMTTAVFLGLMLAFEPKEPDIMDRPPRDANAPILTRSLILRIVIVGTLLLLLSFGLFEWAISNGYRLSQARTIAVNAFVIMELCYLFNCRHLTAHLLKDDFFSNPWVFWGAGFTLVLQLVYTYVPIMQRLFNSASIGWFEWILIFVCGGIVMVIIEFEKMLTRRMRYRVASH